MRDMILDWVIDYDEYDNNTVFKFIKLLKQSDNIETKIFESIIEEE